MNTIMPTAPMPQELTNINTDGLFIKIWGICKKDKAQFVRDLIEVYSNKLVEGVGSVRTMSELIPGKIVVAFYKGAFHRAEIIDFHGTNTMSVIVKLIDVGITTSVDANDIRLADGIFNTAPREGYAEEFILAGVIAKRPWTDQEVDSANQCLSRCAEVMMMGVIADKKLIQVAMNLKQNSVLLSVFLVNTGLAEVIPSEHFSFLLRNKFENKVPIDQFHLPPPTIPTMPMQPSYPASQQTSLRVSAPVFHSQAEAPPPNMPNYQRIRTPKPAPISNAQHAPLVPQYSYIYTTLPVDTKHEVCVSYVIDGMNAFTVQLREAVDVKLPKLMAKINDIRPIPLTDPLGPGVLCLGRYTEDNSLCRAVVSNVLSEGASLYFVDFGNSEVVPFHEIYKIPPEFLQEPTMAMRFGLADLSSNYGLTTTEANAIFTDMALKEDNVFMLKVTKPENPATQSGELFLVINNKYVNIKNKILDKVKIMKPVEYKRLNIKKGQTGDALISFAESPSRFFAQLDMNQTLLEVMMNCVQQYCLTSENKDLLYSEDVIENMAVCAKYEDEKWYRGIIVDEPDNEGNVTIFYVDFGNQDTVHFSNLRIMNNEMMSQFPMQALECRLDMDPSVPLNEEVNSMFVDMADGQNFKMVVKSILPAYVLLVDLMDANELSVAEQLKEAFVEKPITPPVSPSNYSAPPKPHLQKTQSGNWREKNAPDTNHTEGDFSSFRSDNPRLSRADSNTNYSRSDHDDRGKGRNVDSRRKDSDGVDTTDDAWGKKGGDFWGRDKGPRTERQSDNSESWRKDNFSKKFDQENDQQNDRFNKRPPRNEWNGGGSHDRDDGSRSGGGPRDRDDGGRKPYRKRDEEFGDSKRNDEGGWSGRRSSQEDNWGANNAGGERRSGRDGWEKKTSDESFGGRPRRDNRDGDGWKGKRDEGGFNDNRAPRRDNRSNDGASNGDSWGSNQKEQTTTDSWPSSDSWGAKNESSGNRGGGFSDNFGNKREGGFKKRENDGFSRNNFDRGAKKWDNDFASRNTVTLEDGFEKGAQLVDPDYQPGVEMDVIITWFVNPVRFYVMPSDNADFRALMEQVQSEYPKRKTINSNELSANDCVVARDKDNVIYRATVLRTSPRGVVVTFVDYGNTETVGKNQVWAISPDHCAIPKQAICCSLYNISPADENGVWKETVEYDKYFGKDGFKLTVVQCVNEENDKSWIVNLTDNDGLDVSDQLVADKLAIRKFVLASEEPYDISLLLHQTVSVFLGAAESAQKFFVHIEPHKADHIRTCIETLAENAESLVPLPVENIEAGEFCLAPSTDNAYYRALILSENKTENQAHVLFIDYGDEYDVSFDVIITLPDHLKIYNAQAVECCLFESQSFTNDDDFIKAVEEKDFFINVMDVKDNKLHVKVFDVNGVSLPYPVESDETVPAICPLTIIKPIETVMISSLTQEKVYLQRLADQNLLTDSNTRLNDKYESEAEQEKVAVEAGKFYAAKSAQFESWYRCQLAGPESDKVLYIDYGNTEEIETLLAVRPLDEEFYSLPACCVGVSTSADVTSEDVEPLLVAVQDCVFKATFKNTGPNEWFVDLQTEDGKTFGDYVEETNSGSKRPTAPEEVYDAFGNWKLFEEKKVEVSAVYSPSRFYLQLEEDVAKLAGNREDMEQALKIVLPLVGNCNDLCAAKSDDNKWYRCYQTDNVAIDYGFVINPKQYKKLPASFATDRSKYIVECGLNVESPDDQWNDVTIAHFKELIGQKIEIMAKLESCRKQKIVELTLNGDTSVTESLVNEGLAKYKSYQVVLSHVTSLSEFYAQERESEDELFDMLDQLKEAETWETVTPNEGDIVAAKFVDDAQWYRASVTSTTDGVSVRFIDYGNESVCEEFRALPDHLKEIQKFASLCCVHPLPPNADELKEKFVSFVLENPDTPFSVYFLSRIEPMLVMLYCKNCLIEELLKEKPAPTVDFKAVSVVHINSPSSFYVQTETPLLDTVAAELETAESCEPVTEVEENEIYAAKFVDDGLWYRAKSIGNNEVLFVDYGNTSVSDEIRKLPESLKKIPFLAKHCAIPHPTELSEWPEAATERFAELTEGGDTIFNMDIIEESDPAYVHLKNESVDVKEELLQDKSVPVIAFESVSVVHINSPSSFYVQTETPLLDTVAAELETVEGSEPVNDVQVNEIYAAKFVDDGLWYRAKPIGNNEVLFVDFGNKSVSDEIRNLPQSLKTIPFLAKHCAIPTPPTLPKWPEVATERFAELTCEGNTIFKMDIIEEGDPTHVQLKDEGVNVMEELNTLCQAEITATSKENDKPTVILSLISSLDEIWVQEQSPSLDELGDELANMETFDVLETAEENAIVAALFDEDGVWYRAKILEKLDNGFRALFIDYGNESIVSQIRALPEDLAVMPAFATRCRLFGLPEDADQWPSSVIDKLKEISDSILSFVLEKKIEENGAHYVSLLYEGSKDLTDELIKFNDQLSNQTNPDVIEANSELSNQKNSDIVTEKNLDELSNETNTDVVTEAKSYELPNPANPGVITEANSLSEFYIQNDTELVNEVQSAIQNNDIDENIEPVVGNVVVAVKEDDNTCYRSKIESVDENKESCHVFRIDFGGSFVTKKWTRLPEKVIEVAPLATKCSLVVSEDLKQKTSDITERFLDIVKSKNAIFTYRIVGGDDVKDVQLYQNGINILDLLFPEIKPPSTELATSKEENLADELVEEANSVCEPESALNDEITDIQPSSKKELTNEAYPIREHGSAPNDEIKDVASTLVEEPISKANSICEPELATSTEKSLLEEPAEADLNDRMCSTPISDAIEESPVKEPLVEETSNFETEIIKGSEDAEIKPSESVPVETIVENDVVEPDVNTTQKEHLVEKSEVVVSKSTEETPVGDIAEDVTSPEKTNELIVDEIVPNEPDSKVEELIDTLKTVEEPVYDAFGEDTIQIDDSSSVDVTISKLVAETFTEEVKEEKCDISTETEESSDDQIAKKETVVLDVEKSSNVTLDTAESNLNGDVVAKIELIDSCEIGKPKILNGDVTVKVERVDTSEVDIKSDASETKVTISIAVGEVADSPISTETEFSGDAKPAEIAHVSKPTEIKIEPESTVDVVENIPSTVNEPEVEKFDEPSVETVVEDIATKVQSDLNKPEIFSDNVTIKVERVNTTDVVAEVKNLSVEQEASEFTDEVSTELANAVHDEVEHTPDPLPANNESVSTSGNRSENDSLEVNVTSNEEDVDEFDDFKSEIHSSSVSDISKFGSNADSGLNVSGTESLYLSMDEDTQIDKEHDTSNVSDKSCSTFVTEADTQLKSEKNESTIIDEEKPESPKLFDISDNAFNTSAELAEVDVSFKDCSFSVTYVDNPGSFYVQKTSDTKRLNKLEKILQNIEEESEELKLVEIGSLVGAKIENNCVRAKVIDIDDFSGYIVFCIDYGNETTSKKLFALPDKLEVLPPFVKRCGLPLPAHLCFWPVSVQAEFEVITQLGSPTFKLTPLDDSGEIVLVNLTREEVDVWRKITDLCQECDDDEDDAISEDDQFVSPEKTPFVTKKSVCSKTVGKKNKNRKRKQF